MKHLKKYTQAMSILLLIVALDSTLLAAGGPPPPPPPPDPFTGKASGAAATGRKNLLDEIAAKRKLKAA